MARLTLTLLGSFQVTLDGRPVTTFATDKTRALLAYLAVERDRPHRREALAALLWPDQPEQRARQNFRQTLSYLRQALCDDASSNDASECRFLSVERNEVQLNPDADVSLDVAELTALAEACDGHRHRSREQCLPCILRCEAISAMYRGEFLAGSLLADSGLFEEWALLKREWLHTRAVESLMQMADYHERRGDIDKACRCLQRQVRLEPWREEAHRQLMRLLALAGQRSAALAQYETCRHILQAEFGVDPAAETVQLWTQVRTGTFTRPRPAPASLPMSTSPFVGREEELGELAEMLVSPDCRLITLTGPGGIGKTRLALELAGELTGLYAHGVIWVALGTVNATELIVPSIAQSLGLTLYGKEPPQTQLINFLRERTVLLVLDNAEHLPELGTVVEALLQHAPSVTLLVTSRERLALREECVFTLEGLSYPDWAVHSTEGAQADAVEMFLQHIRRIRRRFAPGPDQLAAIMQICRLVEGMPLAVEIAAAWVAERPSALISRELETGLDMLQTTLRNMPERQRSVRATFDHSWKRLPEAERRLFAQLSVFRGSFAAHAAQAVTGAAPTLLASLVTRSLLRKLPDGRYQLHGLLRQFADDKLRATGIVPLDAPGQDTPDEARATQARHAVYYAGFLADREAALKGTGQEAALAAITMEIANVRQAWEWAVSTAADAAADITASATALNVFQRALESLFLFYSLRSWYQEGTAAFARAAEAVGDRSPLLLGELLTRQARCSEFTAPNAEAAALYERSLALFQGLGADRETALPLYGLGYMAHLRGEYETTRRYFTASMDLYEKAGDQWSLANALSSLCLSLRRQGAFSEALDVGHRSLVIRRELGDRRGVASSQNNVGLVQCALGDYAAAEAALGESLSICREIGHTVGAANALTSLSSVALGANDVDRAAHYQREALELFREVGDLWGVAVALNNLGQITLEHGDAAAARLLLQDAATMYRHAGVKAGLTNALSNLGWACDVLGATSEAAQHLHEALALAVELNELPFGLEALTRAAALLSRQESSEGQTRSIQPLTVLAFVMQHPGSLDETRSAATEIQARLQSNLPPAERPAREAEGAALDFRAVAAMTATDLAAIGRAMWSTPIRKSARS